MPNELGLFDMSGNVAEYCSDWYDEYDMTNSDNPKGPPSGTSKVVRGGNFSNYHLYYDVSKRAQTPSITYKNPYTGFRIVVKP